MKRKENQVANKEKMRASIQYLIKISKWNLSIIVKEIMQINWRMEWIQFKSLIKTIVVKYLWQKKISLIKMIF